MPIGYIHGTLEGRCESEYQKILADSLGEVLPAATKAGITLCLEPINRYEVDNIFSVDQAIEFIDKFGFSEMKILADTYHMNIEDADMVGALKRAGDKIGHVHASDSNRLVPGMGHVDYTAILTALDEIGYTGYLSMECLPVPSPVESAKAGHAHLKGILNKLK